MLSTDEYAKLLEPAFTPTTALAKSGKPDTCLMSSSSNRVIDSGATDHMTGNFSLFTTFQSHPSISTITLTDGSKSCVLRSDTINHTPLIPFTYVISLPQFFFNLISMSKVTRTLNYNISFFPGYCLFQDLLTNRVISRGQESEGLYILDPKLSKPIACSRIASLHEVLCRLGHPSLSLLKKLFPQFYSLSLNCESCQYAKLHRMHLSPRVNKQASAHFELIHSDIWGPCLVMSPTGFKYFVTFVDDFSRVTWLNLMKSRYKLFSHFTAFCAEIQTQFHVPAQILRSDNAKKYLSEPFQSFMLQHKILHQTSCVDTPPRMG